MPEHPNGTVILAFSGGLDTSYCVLELLARGYGVVTVFVDTGGVSAERAQWIKRRALDLGATEHHTVQGSADLWHQQFNEINFALVNEHGCAVFQQKITGRFNHPEVSNVRVVKTLIGPLKNIFRGKKCKNPFYTGAVKPFGIDVE